MSFIARCLSPDLDTVERELAQARARTHASRQHVDRRIHALQRQLADHASSPMALVAAACGGFLIGDSPTRRRLRRIEDTLERMESSLLGVAEDGDSRDAQGNDERSQTNLAQKVIRYIYLVDLVMSALGKLEKTGVSDDEDAGYAPPEASA